MAGPKFQPGKERREHLERVAALYGTGLMQYEIAEKCGVSRQQIGYDIQALHEMWVEGRVKDIDAAKIRELAECDRNQQRAEEGWERSLGTLEKKTQKAKPGFGNDKLSISELTIASELGAGDPRFLSIIKDCIAQRCKILGLDAPTKIDLTIRESEDEQVRELRAEREQLDALLPPEYREAFEKMRQKKLPETVDVEFVELKNS